MKARVIVTNKCNRSCPGCCNTTYILVSEDGASLKASGWKCVGKAGGERWTGKRRPEVDLYPAQMKLKFEVS